MLMPKRVKYRKTQRGRMRGKAQRGSTLAFGDFGLKVVLENQVADETRHKEEIERIIAGWDER